MPDEEKPAEAFVPTTADDYPIERDRNVTLPSGARVVLHAPSKYVMMRTGQFPKDVETAIRNSAEQGIAPDFEVRQKTLEILLCQSFVSPKLSMTPKKGHVCVKDIPDRDREFVVFLLGLSVF